MCKRPRGELAREQLDVGTSISTHRMGGGRGYSWPVLP